MHHRLDCVCRLSAGELLLLGFLTDDSGDCEGLGVEVGVDLEHFQGFRLSLLGGRVHCMTLLPEKLRGSQKRAGRLFPANDAAPLVVELGQIAVGLDDLLVVLAKERFGGWTYSQTLGELFLTADRYPRAFGCEALNVVFLSLEKAFGNEHRHIYVLVTCFLEASVHICLHKLPESVAVGTDNHAAFNARIIDQFSLFDNICVPFRKILVAARNSLDHFFIFSHIYSSVVVT